MAMLGDLPPEIVIQILENLPVQDQAVFARAAKWTYKITAQWMYDQNKLHDGSSALYKAAITANIPALKAAIAHGLVPGSLGEKGNSLHIALMSDSSGEVQKEIIEILLQAGADQNQKDRNHLTAFELACKEEYYLEALALLDSRHSQVVLNHRAVNRILHHIVVPLRYRKFEDDIYGKVALEGNKRNVVGSISVHHAQQAELVKRILSMPGVDVNWRRNHSPKAFVLHMGLTPLQVALAHQDTYMYCHEIMIRPNIEVVRMLLEAGARPNAVCADQHRYPLYMAKQLAKLRMDADRVSFDAYAPGHLPSWTELRNLSDLLVFYGARFYPGDQGRVYSRQLSWFTLSSETLQRLQSVVADIELDHGYVPIAFLFCVESMFEPNSNEWGF